MDSEDRMDAMAEAVHDRDLESLNILILDQMRHMSRRGIMPSWQNFTQNGRFWDILQARFIDKEDYFYMRLAWTKYFNQTWPDQKAD